MPPTREASSSDDSDGVWQYRLSTDYAPKVHQRDGLWRSITVTEDDGFVRDVSPVEAEVPALEQGDTEHRLLTEWKALQEVYAKLWRENAEAIVAYEDWLKEQFGKREGGARFKAFYRDSAGIANGEIDRIRKVAHNLPPGVGSTCRIGMQYALSIVDGSDEMLSDAETLSVSDFEIKYGLKRRPKPCGDKCECPIRAPGIRRERSNHEHR